MARRAVLSVAFCVILTIPVTSPAADFLRGDVDGSGRLAIPDAVRILLHLFQPDREQFLQDLATQNGGTYNPLP